ncbi:BREX-1 system adenine-specific DNA-methyltransferase PglX, partial [Leuconostoc lactis]|uniref:BREX-1 system adenine-specific DNA-methyltransferase PglX n=1 Tax=Leuconostoc lactis TaxID=1246 RepID=UPI00101FEAC1
HARAISITGGAVKKSDIPAATQLFTTDWVVRYMVDNSLGKYWLEHEADSKLANELAYLLPGEINPRSENLIIEDIKIMDNAMGSGHILVYAFDVLMKMYQERGYSSRDAAVAIIENNIVGLEIDKRAYQLAYFALFMKAREYNRRILSMGISPKLYVFQDILSIPNEFYEQLSTSVTDDLQNLAAVFKDATELGSIIQLDKTYNIPELRKAVSQIKVIGLDIYGLTTAKDSIQNMLNIVDTLQSKYEIIVTNPPYMNKFEPNLKKYIGQHYAPYKGDLFAVFIYNNLQLLKKDGYAAYMTPFVWMFIKTYEALRTYILDTKQISSLIQMEYSAFEEATVPINTFVIKNTINQELGSYVKLSEFTGGMSVQDQKVQDIIKNPDAGYLYRTNQANFEKIPGSPIAYWASNALLHDFEVGVRMDELVDPRQGLATADNNRFLRQWYEIDIQNISFNSKSIAESIVSNKKWFPYNKGGAYRKWYGNYDYVVNWENDGAEIRNFKGPNGKIRSRPQNTDYYFREAITWSDVNSGKFSLRYREYGSIHDVKGMSAFETGDLNLFYLLGLLNSPLGNYIFGLLNPTISLQIGNFQSFPVLKLPNDTLVSHTSHQSVDLAKEDWDAFETSWDFDCHPLLSKIAEHNRNWTVEAAFKEWQDEAQARFDQLKANEEELNRIFIDLYGLQDELTPEVDNVSVRLAKKERDIKSLLSYFIGLVFGRYSLDIDGLAYAGGEFDKSKYKSFMPNAENVVMLTDADYFGDERDIISRFKEFLTATFGEENLATNMTYIANVLGGKGTPEEVVRNYFFKDFSKDHNQTYKKRPIYWQLESGKQGGFKALIYLHRYDADTMAMIRTNYLNELQAAYESRLSTLTNLIDTANDTKSKNAFEKQRAKLLNQLDELVAYEAKIAYLANKHVVLDLDDGVVENYKKVQLDEDNQSLGVFRKI